MVFWKQKISSIILKTFVYCLKNLPNLLRIDYLAFGSTTCLLLIIIMDIVPVPPATTIYQTIALVVAFSVTIGVIAGIYTWQKVKKYNEYKTQSKSLEPNVHGDGSGNV